MKIRELADLISAKNMTPLLSLDTDISCGYTCDLLSWVMAHGKPGMAWVTVQTHMNVVAVATLMEMAVVIIPEGIEMEAASLEKAANEALVVLQSPLSAYAICGLMVKQGVSSDC
jgi:DRTGG domain.